MSRETTPNGAYAPKPSSFRDRVENTPGARFRAQAGRYHLYVMDGCPWAHRTLIVRALKGLEAAIDVTAVHHHLSDPSGWSFAAERPDPLYGVQHLRALYEMADPGFDGRVTVPMLWDKQERTIVNNESSEIMRMLNDEFDDFAAHPDVDLYPAALHAEIDRWNERLQPTVCAGAYRVGFATTQAAYDEALPVFFAALDELEAHLATQRFLVGDRPTEADWRLFPALLRFEWVYHGLFRCNLRRLVDLPNLFAYTCDLYQWPGIAATVNEHHIRHGYFRSMLDLNPRGIVPAGPRVDFHAPHGRHSLGH